MIAFRMMDEDEDFLFAGNLVIVPCLELVDGRVEIGHATICDPELQF